MSELTQAKNPFRFYTRLHLSELTGCKAANLQELLSIIREVSGSSIYHHTHRFLQQHQYLSPEPPNDFAYFVSDVLGEDELSEKLSSIDTIQFNAIRALRNKIIATIEDYLKNNPRAGEKFARPDEEFHFIKSISFIIPTKHIAYNLRDFREIISKITIDSIYFHIFESRLRLERRTNDFSYWIDTSLDEKPLAEAISNLDPYTYTLEELRKTTIKLVSDRIKRC